MNARVLIEVGEITQIKIFLAFFLLAARALNPFDSVLVIKHLYHLYGSSLLLD